VLLNWTVDTSIHQEGLTCLDGSQIG
jgi:hypothetical protein